MLRFDIWGREMEKFQSITWELTTANQHGVFVTAEAHELLREKMTFYSNILRAQFQ